MNCPFCGAPGTEHESNCDRLKAIWHIENEVPDDAPCADFDEPREREE